MARINPNDPRPPYAQIADELRKKIRSGQMQPGEKLQSVRELAEQYGVSHMTVSHAVRQLREERLLVTWQGRGVFVRDPTAEPVPTDSASAAYEAVMRRLDLMYDDMQQLGDRLSRLEHLVDEDAAQDGRSDLATGQGQQPTRQDERRSPSPDRE